MAALRPVWRRATAIGVDEGEPILLATKGLRRQLGGLRALGIGAADRPHLAVSVYTESLNLSWLMLKIVNHPPHTGGRLAIWGENARATPRRQDMAGSLLSWQPTDSWTPSKLAGAARALSTTATKRLLREA